MYIYPLNKSKNPQNVIARFPCLRHHLKDLSAIFSDLTLLLSSLVSEQRHFYYLQNEWIITNHTMKQRVAAVWVNTGRF
jgi:hypothetical protein